VPVEKVGRIDLHAGGQGFDALPSKLVRPNGAQIYLQIRKLMYVHWPFNAALR
jgi:hypothetical protein